jgi:hypothetical protein
MFCVSVTAFTLNTSIVFTLAGSAVHTPWFSHPAAWRNISVCVSIGTKFWSNSHVASQFKLEDQNAGSGAFVSWWAWILSV